MSKENAPLVVLGVTGGIAAFKAAALCSMMVKAGLEVQVVMTAGAEKFVTALTFRTLSRRPVMQSLWEIPQWQPGHVALASEAKLFVVAPATANFLAKYANGIADDALTTFAAAFNGPVLIAPAMNPEMWTHWSCQENVEKLRRHGIVFAGPASGHVACGGDGPGRMSEPGEIFEAVLALLKETGASWK